MRCPATGDDDLSLERSCSEGRGDRFVHDAIGPGLERLDARMLSETYARHRHDTFAIGLTLRGVQTFFYRGEERVSLPGQSIILHPDEVHDGAAGDDDGLRYRMLYLDPAKLEPALDGVGSGLPFVADPVSSDPCLIASLRALLGGTGDIPDELEQDFLLAGLAVTLVRLSGAPIRPKPVCGRNMHLVREFIDADPFRPIRSADLEAVADLDRFTLARQFRARYSTSPHRYLLMRRLQAARLRIAEGGRLAEVAQATGFADQAHFSRHFKKTYGITPGRWAHLSNSGRRDPSFLSGQKTL